MLPAPGMDPLASRLSGLRGMSNRLQGRESLRLLSQSFARMERLAMYGKHRLWPDPMTTLYLMGFSPSQSMRLDACNSVEYTDCFYLRTSALRSPAVSGYPVSSTSLAALSISLAQPIRVAPRTVILKIPRMYLFRYASFPFVTVPGGVLHRGSRWIKTPAAGFFIALLDPNIPESLSPPTIVSRAEIYIDRVTSFDLIPDVRSSGDTRFQWYFEGQAIAGGNNFFLTNVPPTSNGNFSLVVSNQYGSASNIVAYVGQSQKPVLSAGISEKGLMLSWPFAGSEFSLVEGAESPLTFVPLSTSRMTNFGRARFEVVFPLKNKRQFL